MMRKYSLALLALLTVTSLAQAETVKCKPIAKLPFTITLSGMYSLSKDLEFGSATVPITTGNAITITADDVTLDLNGHVLSNTTAGSGTQTTGIYALQRSHITIRNGKIRNFEAGIWLQDFDPFTTSNGHIIEDIVSDHNYVEGFIIQGTNSLVRNNRVTGVGGSTTAGGNNIAYGVEVDGYNSRIINNDVIDAITGGSGDAVGIFASRCSYSIIANNHITNLASHGGGSGWGIRTDTCSNIAINDNHIAVDTIYTATQNGIYFGVSSGTYMNNVVQGATTAYTGGTAIGSTNY